MPGRVPQDRLVVVVSRLVGCLAGLRDLGDQPAEAGQFTGRRDRDDRPSVRAGLDVGRVDVQALLGIPRDRFLSLAVLQSGSSNGNGAPETL